MRPLVVLAFSGGLDTSFCVPYLIDQGYDVVTLFVDTGGVRDEARGAIAQRSCELGARRHIVHDASAQLWDTIATPLVMGGVSRQEQYPILCSDRYLIAAALASCAHELGAVAVAHGCTGMGNDQVRLDQSLRCLTTLPVVAPIREIQSLTDSLRAYEIEQLQSRGVAVDDAVQRYSINENLLGATISGGEIDTLDAPAPDARRLTSPRADWPAEPLRVDIRFEQGRAVSLENENIPGPQLLAQLNVLFGAFGVGRGVYTGDTIIGLKGRIVYEAPGLAVLLAAHRALEEIVLSKEQNAFKPIAARQWTDLLYTGLYFDPLRANLEAFVRSTQERVTGVVTVETWGGSCQAIAVNSPHSLLRHDAVYAQKANWSGADAEGFIKLFGLSSATAVRRRPNVATLQEEAPACSIAS